MCDTRAHCASLPHDAAPAGLKPDSPSGSYARAWAAYIVKWFDGMQSAGIDFWGLTPQNEMFANQRCVRGG